jgi:hypothetical protein
LNAFSIDQVRQHPNYPDALRAEIETLVARQDAKALLSGGGGTNWVPHLAAGFPADDKVNAPSMFMRDADSKPGWNTTEGGYGYPGALHLLFGARAAGKTWLAGLWTVQEMKKEHHVVWYSFEAQRGVTERLTACGAGDETAPFLHYLPASGAPSDDDILAACAEIRGWPVSLVVLDAMRGLQALLAPGTSANDGDAIETVNQRLLVPFVRAGAAVLLLDHRPKDTANASAFGSERKESMADVVMRMDRGEPFGRDRDGYSTVTVTKDRYGYNTEDNPACFVMSGGEPSFTERVPMPSMSAGAFMSTPESRKITVLGKVLACPAQYMRQVQLARDLLEGNGESLATWRRTVRDMLGVGELVTVNGFIRAPEPKG